MSDPVEEWEARNAGNRAAFEASIEERETTPAERVFAGLGRLERKLASSRAWREGRVAAIRELQPPAPVLTDDERRRAWLDRCRVPPAYHGCTRETWRSTWRGRPSPWPEKASTWAGEPWSLTLKGRPGIGKSHVAAAVLVEWARNRRGKLRLGKEGVPARVRWVSVPRACREIQASYDDQEARIYGRRPAEFYSWVAETWDLVVFDDVGAQRDTEAWLTIVSGWLYDRHGAQLPTILTLNPGDYRGLEDRAARRVADGIVIDMEGG